MASTSFETAKDLIASALGCDGNTIWADAAIAVHPNWDSISHLNIMMLLEQEFGVEINDVTITQFTTLAAIERLFLDNKQ